ncbi:MAG: hypothetical protein IH836_02095 [Proteobacteria bacterium]|nr:hypothetical protein [Pseudomonadota bacterium]
MPTSQKTQQLVASFQRYAKTGDVSEIIAYSVSELKSALRDLDWRDPGIQSAIKDRIETLESKSDKKCQSVVRAVGYVVALAIAIVAVIFGAKFL